MLARVGGEHPLSQARRRYRPRRSRHSVLRASADRPSSLGLRARIAGRDERHRLAAVGPRQAAPASRRGRAGRWASRHRCAPAARTGSSSTCRSRSPRSTGPRRASASAIQANGSPFSFPAAAGAASKAAARMRGRLRGLALAEQAQRLGAASAIHSCGSPKTSGVACRPRTLPRGRRSQRIASRYVRTSRPPRRPSPCMTSSWVSARSHCPEQHQELEQEDAALRVRRVAPHRSSDPPTADPPGGVDALRQRPELEARAHRAPLIEPRPPLTPLRSP